MLLLCKWGGSRGGYGKKLLKTSSKDRDSFHWRSSVAYKTKEKIVIRGYDNDELMGNIDLASMAYLGWTGELPSDNYRLMLNALLVSLAEHAFSPSAVSCRMVASGGVPLNTAVAGAVEKATKQVYGRTFYMNAPGAMAAIGSDMGLTPEQIKGLMILSRTVSLVGHSIEEMEREKGWRASGKSNITQPLELSLQLPEYYDGPDDRNLRKL